MTTPIRSSVMVMMLLTVGLGLTACSGSSADGDYVVSHDERNLIVATVSGDQVTVASRSCLFNQTIDTSAEISEDDDPATGTLNEDQTSVLWSSSPKGSEAHYATDGGYDDEWRSPVSFSETELTLGNETYAARDSSQGEQIIDSVTAACES